MDPLPAFCAGASVPIREWFTISGIAALESDPAATDWPGIVLMSCTGAIESGRLATPAAARSGALSGPPEQAAIQTTSALHIVRCLMAFSSMLLVRITRVRWRHYRPRWSGRGNGLLPAKLGDPPLDLGIGPQTAELRVLAKHRFNLGIQN